MRIPTDELSAICFVHLVSNPDLEDTATIRQGVVRTLITGYTEWISENAQPAISIGWDWRLEHVNGRLEYVRCGLPRSNIMLVDARKNDVGVSKTEASLAAIVDALEWRAVVDACMAKRSF